MSPVADVLATGCISSQVFRVTLERSATGQVVGAQPPVPLGKLGSTPRDITFSPDGVRVAGGTLAGTLHLLHLDGSGAPEFMESHAEMIGSVSFSADGSYILTSSRDEILRLWPADGDGKARTVVDHRQVTGRDRAFHWAGFSPNGRYFAAVSQDATVRVWPAQRATSCSGVAGTSRYGEQRQLQPRRATHCDLEHRRNHSHLGRSCSDQAGRHSRYAHKLGPVQPGRHPRGDCARGRHRTDLCE